MSENTRDLNLYPTLTTEQLMGVAPYGDEITFNVGDVLFEQGQPSRFVFFQLDGEVEITRQTEAGEVILVVHQPGEFSGEMSMLVGGDYIASGRALMPTRVIRMDAAQFRRLLAERPDISTPILVAMANRRQDVSALTQQREKLISLGTLAAGLAHELNNPASAACRASGQLKMSFGQTQVLALRLGQHLNDAQLSRLFGVLNQVTESVGNVPALDTVAQSDREDEIGSWLDGCGVENSWEIAPLFVSAGIDKAGLQAIAEQFEAKVMNAAVTWLAAALDGIALADSIERSTTRVAELVSAVKSYAYMDQAAVQELDVHDGLENTLIILRHKLRDARVTVVREYDRALPRITASGGELNQLWTNLIDNAIDAMADQSGKASERILTLHTERDDDHVLVSIGDNGVGIPPDVQARIFEPFFTTKGPGQGTGIGLDVAYRIVVVRHNGDIRVESKPGDTCFIVRLPVNK